MLVIHIFDGLRMTCGTRDEMRRDYHVTCEGLPLTWSKGGLAHPLTCCEMMSKRCGSLSRPAGRVRPSARMAASSSYSQVQGSWSPGGRPRAERTYRE